MSAEKRYTILIVLILFTATVWGVSTDHLLGTPWYWVTGILLAALSGYLMRRFRQLSEKKHAGLILFEFGLLVVFLVISYLGWMIHHKP